MNPCNKVRGVLTLLLVTLTACQTQQQVAKQISQLTDTAWKAERIGDSAVAPGIESRLEFEKEGDVAGFTGCNVYVSQLLQQGDFVQFTEVMKAGVQCSPEAQEQEDRFVEALGSARRIELGRDQLTLRDEAGKPVLLFRRMPKLHF